MELSQVLKDCKKGRNAAQKAVYDRFARHLFVLCRRYVKSDAAAEEVLHNGFLKFFTTLDRFVYESEAATVAWMKKILVNECLMHLRRGHSFLQVGLDEAQELAAADDGFDRFETAHIYAAIMQLPVGYRTVFNLHVLDQFGHKEIAVMLGITEGTSKSQLSKARALLQQILIRSNPEYALRKTR
jgi:RNA polymerase sigma factor (sigma-70 family)